MKINQTHLIAGDLTHNVSLNDSLFNTSLASADQPTNQNSFGNSKQLESNKPWDLKRKFLVSQFLIFHHLFIIYLGSSEGQGTGTGTDGDGDGCLKLGHRDQQTQTQAWEKYNV